MEMWAGRGCAWKPGLHVGDGMICVAAQRRKCYWCGMKTILFILMTCSALAESPAEFHERWRRESEAQAARQRADMERAAMERRMRELEARQRALERERR